MKNYLRYSANVVTGLALLLGVTSIVNAVRGCHQGAAILIPCAAVLDAMDGWIARMTNGATRIGTVLDSISDFVSFCIAPAVLLYMWRLSDYGAVGAVACVFLALCGGLRLVRFVFQAETKEKTGFTGMPTPASAVVVAAGVWACTAYSGTVPGLMPVALGMAFLLGILMVSEVPYGSPKRMMTSGAARLLLLLAVAGALFLVFILKKNTGLLLFALAVLYMLSGIVRGTLDYVGRQREEGTS